MKRSNKYNLLQKNEPKKEKTQQQWVQMQSVSNWHGKATNNDVSYVRFQQEQISQVERDNVPQIKNYQPSPSQINAKRMAYLQKESLSQQESNKLPSQKSSTIQARKAQQKSQYYSKPSVQQKQQQYSSSYMVNPTTSTSARQSQFNNYPINGRQSTYNYDATNNLNYSNAYQQQQQQLQSMYMPNRNSQYNNNLNYTSNQSYYPQQSNQQQPHLSTIQQSSISPSSSLQSTRPQRGIPQMTVNCQKCTFTQSVPGNSQMYICCMCNQINQCFPLYGIFTCGICRANVIYPHGTSRLIKCTKCLTVNRVNPQPSKQIDNVVTMGKQQRVELQEEYVQKQIIDKISQIEGRCDVGNKMRRYQNQDEQRQYQRKQVKENLENTLAINQQQRPFKILPVRKNQLQQQQQQPIDFFNLPEQQYQHNNNMKNTQPQITQDNIKQLKREYTEVHTIQFQQELIDLSRQFFKAKNQNINDDDNNNKRQLHQEFLQLATKLDQQCNVNNTKQSQQKHNKNNNNNNRVQYPSIFDD